MTQRILIDAAHSEEVRVVLEENGRLEDFDFESASKKLLKSNIYLGKVTRVEPSLQAAFVEYGGNRQGFLPFSEIDFNYFQIPVADRQKLQQELADLEAQASQETEETDHKADTERQEETESGEAVESPEAEKDTKPKRRSIRTKALAVKKDEPSVSEEGTEEKPKRRGRPAKKKDVEPEPAAEAADTEKLEDTESKEAEKKPKRRGRPAKKKTDDLSAATPSEPSKTEESVENGVSDELPDFIDNTDDGDTGDDITTETDDLSAATRKRRINFYRKYKIQEVIKRNQIVLVQVVKEERGMKGAALTTYMSLAGRYCVLMPNTERAGGVSRRITDGEARKKLRHAVDGMDIPKGMSVIIRTAGVDQEEKEIQRDFSNLMVLWNDIREKTLAATAPALIYEEGNVIKRTLRDIYRSSVDQIVVEGKEAYETTKTFMEYMAPDDVKKLSHYTETIPLFRKYGIDAELEHLFDNKVPLQSGGTLVIAPTEALVSIDVNSGSATRERSIEETALKTNLEAAREVARQLRLRDLAGLVVIDFIDMRELRNRRAVEKELKNALKTDRARVQVGRISQFGLMEMSRQRLRASIAESSTAVCSHCNGTGFVRSSDSVSVTLLRAIESEASREEVSIVRIRMSGEAAMNLLNHKRDELSAIEAECNVTIEITQDYGLHQAEYHIDRPRGQRDGRRGGGRNRRGGKNRNNRRNDEENTQSTKETSNTEQPQSSTESTSEQPKRGRGRRKKSDAVQNIAPSENVEASPDTQTAKNTASETPSATQPDAQEETQQHPRRSLAGNKIAAKKHDEESISASSKELSKADKAERSRLKSLWDKIAG